MPDNNTRRTPNRAPQNPQNARTAQNPGGAARPQMSAEEYARRRAAYERRKAYEAEMARRAEAEKQRKKKERQRAVRVFFGRLIVFFIILAILAAVAALIFVIRFNHTKEEKQPAVVRYSYGGTAGGTLDESLAFAGGVTYLDFNDAASYLDMTVIGGAEQMRYVIRSAAGETDSAGDGSEESVIFFAGSDLASVNGQNVRLSAPAVLVGEHYLVPADFLTEYMRGVTVTRDGNSVDIARTYTDDAPDALSFTLQSAAVLAPLPEDVGLGEIDPGAIRPTDDAPKPTESDLDVTFTADLSAYEPYMNPADRDGYLILVNNHSTIDAAYLPDDLTDLADTRRDGRNTQQMRKTAAMALEAMYIEMRACGFTDVSVTSAYRSYSYQNSLFNMYTANELAANPSLTLAQAQEIAATYSARPGTSEHQTGLCCDMHNLPAADQAFAKEDVYQWLCGNAWKFGFILRFPEGKEDITEISFEPWHYRFVGRYHAKAIHDAGLCLEEYLGKTE